MKSTEITSSLEVKTFSDAFLYSCITPAFIWSLADGSLIAANAMGFELLKKLSPYEQPEKISDVFRNWNEISDASHHAMWMDMVTRDGSVRSIQVRNSYLTPEKDVLATVVVNPRWRVESGSDQSMAVLTRIAKAASVTFCSRTDFLEGIESFLDMACIELNLSEFGFLPEAVFRQYDLYDSLYNILKVKTFYPFIADQQKTFSRFPKNVLSAVELQHQEAPANLHIFPVTNSESNIGYFLLKFRESSSYQPDYFQTILEVVSVFMQNLFESMEMTKSLYQSEFENTLNAQIIDNISEGVIITNTEYQIVYINQMSSMMFGFAPSDVIGHPLDDLLVTTEGVSKLVQSLSDNDSPHETSDASSIQYLHRRSGESFPCHIRLSFLDFDEKNKYTIFVLTDNTETEESRLKTEQLAQRAFLGDFASMLAHEIRNPINNMSIWLQNIKSLTQEEDEVYQAANRIEEDCSRVSHLISNILAFSRPLKLNLEETDLSQYLNETIDRWKLNFARANIKTYYSAPDDLPKIFIDPRSMEQVFNNLIGNAVDAFDNKGGVISFKLSLHESEIGRKQILISVSDNGPGIPDELIDHIFEPFVTSKKKGNGWGLALSKRIITSHKGTVQVKSYPGGTVFEIMLPTNSGG